MKKTIYATAVFAAFMLFSSCTGNSAKTDLELALWGSPEELKIVKKSMKEFYKNNPGIKVKLTHMPPGPPYIDKMLTRSVANDLPDVIFMEVNFIERFVEKGVVRDLTPFIESDPDFSTADYFPEIIDRFTVTDRIYGLPRDVAPFACIYYNKNIFEQTGVDFPVDSWTLEDFVQKGQQLTKHDANGRTTQWGFFCWSWMNFYYTFGARLVDDERNPKESRVNSTEARKALQFYKDLQYKHRIMPAPGDVEISQKEAFMTGQVAMYLSGIWETPEFRSITDFDWDVVMFPKGPSGKRYFQTGGSGYAISKSTKNEKLAWELLKVIAGKNGQSQLARLGLAQPALKSLAESDIWAQDKRLPPLNKGMLNEAVKHIVFSPMIPGWSEIEWKILNNKIDLIIRNELDMEEGLKLIEKEMNAELEKLTVQ